VEEVIVQPAEVPSPVPPSVSSETDSEPAQLRNEVEEVKNSVLSAQMLVREQKNDSELQQLRKQAISEVEANKVPGCYYLKGDILMRKWRPKVVPASHEWSVVHQVVVPPL